MQADKFMALVNTPQKNTVANAAKPQEKAKTAAPAPANAQAPALPAQPQKDSFTAQNTPKKSKKGLIAVGITSLALLAAYIIKGKKPPVEETLENLQQEAKKYTPEDAKEVMDAFKKIIDAPKQLLLPEKSSATIAAEADKALHEAVYGAPKTLEDKLTEKIVKEEAQKIVDNSKQLLLPEKTASDNVFDSVEVIEAAPSGKIAETVETVQTEPVIVQVKEKTKGIMDLVRFIFKK